MLLGTGVGGGTVHDVKSPDDCLLNFAVLSDSHIEGNNYTRYKVFAQSLKDAKKNQKTVDIKEVRLTLNIGEHDLQVKVKSAYKFLQDGDKVKVTVKFYGREMNYTKSGEELLDRFSESISEVGVMDKRPKMEGRRMTAMFSPKK